MSKFAVVVLCVVLAAVPALAACGGGDDGKTDTKQANIARNSFLYKVNSVCEATNAATDPVQPKSVSQVPTAAATLIPAQQAQLISLRKLTPPDELKPTWNRILVLLQQQITLLGQIQAKAKAGATVREVKPIVELLNQATVEGQQRALAMGLPNCGT